MPVRISLSTGEDKTGGVQNVEEQFQRFMTSHNWELAPDPAPSKADVTAAIGELWDHFATIGPSLLTEVSGPLNTSDEEQILVLEALIAEERLRQYRAQLPGGVPPGP